MPYLLIDDGFPENRKIAALSDRAFRLHVTALVYCARNLTDGAISELALAISSANSKIERPKQTVQQLVSVGLWVPNGDGWKIHEYLQYNPSRADIEAKRQQTRERKRRFDRKRNAVTERVTERESNASKDPTKRALKGSLEVEPKEGSPRGTPVERQAAALTAARKLAATWKIPDSDAFATALDELSTEHRATLRAADREALWDTARAASAQATDPDDEPEPA